MAFDNVTFFELHLDGARFGGESVEAADETEVATEADSGRRGFPVGLLVVLGVGVAVAARRMRRSKELELDLEDAEPITVE